MEHVEGHTLKEAIPEGGMEIDRFFESFIGSHNFPQYDVSSDGQRFLMVRRYASKELPKIMVVQNWYAEFKDRE